MRWLVGFGIVEIGGVLRYCEFLDFNKMSASFKTLLTFHYTGWLIGILTMAYYNPYITG